MLMITLDEIVIKKQNDNLRHFFCEHLFIIKQQILQLRSIIFQILALFDAFLIYFVVYFTCVTAQMIEW